MYTNHYKTDPTSTQIYPLAYIDYLINKFMSNINEFKVLKEPVYHIFNTIYQNHASVVHQLT